MKYLQTKMAINTMEKLSLATVDIVKIFEKTGYIIETKDCKFPKPRWEDASVLEIGSTIKAVLPIDAKWLYEGKWNDVVMYISVIVGADLSTIIQGSWVK